MANCLHEMLVRSCQNIENHKKPLAFLRNILLNKGVLWAKNIGSRETPSTITALNERKNVVNT
jgi:hypothetical protein